MPSCANRVQGLGALSTGLFSQRNIAEEEDPRIFLATKMKRYFPNLEGPKFHSSGKQYALYFMEYAFLTDMVFESAVSAECWLCSQAIPVIDEIHARMVRHIERERSNTTKPGKIIENSAGINVKQDNTRDISISNRPIANFSPGKGSEKLINEEFRFISSSTPINFNKNDTTQGAFEPKMSVIPLNVPAKSEQPGNLHSLGSSGQPLKFKGEDVRAEEGLTYAQAFSDIIETQMDGLLKNCKPSRPEIFSMNKTPVKEHHIQFKNVLSTENPSALSKCTKFEGKKKRKSVPPSEHSVNLSNLGRKKCRTKKNTSGIFTKNTNTDSGNISSTPNLSGEMFASYSQIFESEDLSLLNDHNTGANLTATNDTLLSETRDISPMPDFGLFCKRFSLDDSQFIDIVRAVCFEYDLFHPEYELVRENDVYRCTATFCGMNFVSPYLYDKYEAKNAACNKVYEYLISSWNTVCFYNISFRRKESGRF